MQNGQSSFQDSEMGLFSLGTVTGLVFVLYAGHTSLHLYNLFHPPVCGPNDGLNDCIKPRITPPAHSDKWPLLQLRVFISTGRQGKQTHVHTFREFDIGLATEKEVTFALPSSTRKNGTLHAFVYLLPHEYEGLNPSEASWVVDDSISLSTWKVPAASAFNLMGGEDETQEVKEENERKRRMEKPVTHIRSVIPIRVCSEVASFKTNEFPQELRGLVRTNRGEKGEIVYLPMMRIEALSMRINHLREVKSTNETTSVTLSYAPSSIGKMRLFLTTEIALKQFADLHLSEDDLDEVKGIFVDTNPLLLAVTILVSALHLCFDVLAFKNDISFWRNKKTMYGLSTKTLIWRAVSSTIIFLYLAENKTSLLVLGPSLVGVLIEYWKVAKALKLSIVWSRGIPRIQLGTQTRNEAETDNIDAQAMYYLSLLLVPLCIGGATYSLLYQPHRSWRSWILQTAANGVYAFGFLFMLPQLFLNYKLKSVAHLPWRAFMYKAFNTFIDDLFAFIITMPTAHRMACFRDDIVFLVYLYQKWLYPVDKSRVNEFGEEFGEEEEKNEESSPSKGTNTKKIQSSDDHEKKE